MADIDFANSDSRMKFLQENLGHLMGGIDKNYSKVLMDELIVRLEKTVSEFNDEVKEILGQLQGKAEATNNIFGSGKAGENESQSSKGLEGLSEFEKRLEALDK